MKYFNKVLLLFVIISTTSTAAFAQTPIQFNDKLVSITDSLYARGQQWGLRFNDAYKSKNYSSLRPYRQSLERFVDEKIISVKAMKDVKNSRPLRMAMLDFLIFEKGMITKAFLPLESLGSEGSEDQVKAALAKLTEYSNQESIQLEKVNAAQEAYAKENGFTIEKPKASEGDE
jgi:hypothetical protein